MLGIQIADAELRERDFTASPPDRDGRLFTVIRLQTPGIHRQSNVLVCRGPHPRAVVIGMLQAYRQGVGNSTAEPRYTVYCEGHIPLWQALRFADDWPEVLRCGRAMAVAEARLYLAWDEHTAAGAAVPA